MQKIWFSNKPASKKCGYQSVSKPSR